MTFFWHRKSISIRAQAIEQTSQKITKSAHATPAKTFWALRLAREPPSVPPSPPKGGMYKVAESPVRGGKNIGRGGALAEPLCNGTHHPASPVRGGRYSCQAEFLHTDYHRFGKISFFEDNTDNENNNFILTICLVLSTSINCLYCSYCLLNQKNLCVLCVLCILCDKLSA